MSATIEPEAVESPDLNAKVRRRPLAFDKLRSLGTPADERFDRIVRLARRVCDVPVASVDVRTGDAPAAAPRTRSRPLRFRKDIALFVQGRPVGALRVGDFVPRTLDGAQEEMLRELASLAEQEIAKDAVQRALAEENELLRRWAFVDDLTSIWNRHAIWDIALREAEAARAHDQTIGLAVIDLDFFKRVNDTHGHAAGDAVLREVSARLRSAVRATDAVGRFGGEEFLVVMPECSLATAVAAGERIRKAIAEPMQVGGVSLTITASIGVAVHGGGGRTLDDTLRAADVALYRAKAHGRDQVAVASRQTDSTS